jgi:hypothetical protein
MSHEHTGDLEKGSDADQDGRPLSHCASGALQVPLAVSCGHPASDLGTNSRLGQLPDRQYRR